MSAELDTIQPIPDDLIPPGERQSRDEIKTENLVRPEETDPQAAVLWSTPEERIAKLPVAEQLLHYKTAWRVQTAKLERARKENESMRVAWYHLTEFYAYWIDRQTEDIKMSAAMAFGREYATMQDAALAQAENAAGES